MSRAEPEKPLPSRRIPSGNRLIAVVVGLVLLAVLAVVAVVIGGDEDGTTTGDASGTTAGPTSSTATTPAGVASSDAELAVRLLPAIGALGADWVDTSRDDAASEVTAATDDPCSVGPIPAGVLVRNEQRRLVDGDVAETLSVTAGVLAAGAVPADLASAEVRACLLAGLEQAVQPGATVALVEPDRALAAPAGASVGLARFAITTPDGTAGGLFDFVLVQRGRGVSLGLLGGLPGADPTPLDDVAVALDAPLRAAADQLG